MESLLRDRVELLCEGVRERVWVPAVRLGHTDYCEENIVLSTAEAKDYAGPFSRRMIPSVCRFMDEFFDGGDGERWREGHVTKGSQSAMSANALMAMVRKSDYEPANVVYGIDAQPNALMMSARFVRFLRSNERMRGTVEACDERDLQGQNIKLPGMEIWFVGAGSVGQIASKPGVDLVVVDETENHKVPKSDAETLDLFKARGKATVSGKLLSFSKPTTEEGQQWRAVQRGSGHRDFVPCPHCGHMQYLRHGQLRWKHLKEEDGSFDLEKIRKGAVYECESCEEFIEEKDKFEMLQQGELRPTHFVEREVRVSELVSGEVVAYGEDCLPIEVSGFRFQGSGADDEADGDEVVKVLVPRWEPGVMSFYHSDLYALWEKARWGDIALALHLAGNDPVKLKAVFLDTLGIAWKEGGGRRVRLDDLRGMRGDYLREFAPWEPRFVGMFADTQDDRWKAVLMAFSGEGDFAVCDWGEFGNWESLKGFFSQGVKWGERVIQPKVALVDEGGHRTWEVRQNCRRLYPVFHPSKGLGGVQTIGRDTVHWRNFDLYKTSGECPEKVKVLNYDDDAFRGFLYRTLILDRLKSDEESGHGELLFPANVTDDFLSELCHEYQVKKAGKWGWETDGANDFGDTVKMGLIGFSAFGHRF